MNNFLKIILFILFSFSNAFSQVETEVDLFEQQFYESFLEMANQDDAYGQFMMGIIYYNGSGIEKDLVKSYVWFSLSYNNGYKEAKTALIDVRAELNEQQKAIAEEAIANWIPPNPLTEEEKLIKRLEEFGIKVMSTFGYNEEQAIKDIDEALKISTKLDDKNILILVYTAKAQINELYYYNYDEALKAYELIRQLHSDASNYYAEALINIKMGNLSYKIHQNTIAENYYSEALKLFKKSNESEVGKELINANRGNVLGLLEKVAEIKISNNSKKADRLIETDESLRSNMYEKELVGLAIQLYRKDKNFIGEAKAYALLAKYDQGGFVNFYTNQSNKLLKNTNSSNR